MAKRSSDARSSKRIVEEELDNPPDYLDEYIEEFLEDEPKMVRLRLLVDVRLNIVGKQTGTMYHFYGAGSEADVDENDVEIMMKKRVGEWCDGCPSSSGPQPYFEIVS